MQFLERKQRDALCRKRGENDTAMNVGTFGEKRRAIEVVQTGGASASKHLLATAGMLPRPGTFHEHSSCSEHGFLQKATTTRDCLHAVECGGEVCAEKLYLSVAGNVILFLVERRRNLNESAGVSAGVSAGASVGASVGRWSCNYLTVSVSVGSAGVFLSLPLYPTFRGCPPVCFIASVLFRFILAIAPTGM